MGLFDTLKDIAFKAGGQHEIDDFKAMVGKRGGLAKPNRFVVMMNPPAASFINTDWQGMISSALTGNLGFNDLINDPRDMAMLCKSCSFPGQSMNTIEYERNGFRNQIKVPYTYSNEDVTMTFHLTNDYYMKKTMDKWINLPIDQKNHTIRYKDSYVADIIIQQLDNENRPIYGIKLEGAYPVAVNSVALDNAASDTTAELSVTFTYDQFVPEGSINSIFSGGKNLLGGIKKLF